MLAPKLCDSKLIAHWLTDLCRSNVWAIPSAASGPTYNLEYNEENSNDFAAMLARKICLLVFERKGIFFKTGAKQGQGLVIGDDVK